MSETDMLTHLQTIWENITDNGDRAIYSEMLVLLDDIRYHLREDLQIDYPQRFYEELENTERIPFDF